jgi:hypothetical protein
MLRNFHLAPECPIQYTREETSALCFFGGTGTRLPQHQPRRSSASLFVEIRLCSPLRPGLRPAAPPADPNFPFADNTRRKYVEPTVVSVMAIFRQQSMRRAMAWASVLGQAEKLAAALSGADVAY